MRVVIIAAAVTALVTGWLLSETDSAPPTPLVPAAVIPAQSTDFKTLYRSETAECKREGIARKACERRARDRVLGEVRREAARISLR